MLCCTLGAIAVTAPLAIRRRPIAPTVARSVLFLFAVTAGFVVVEHIRHFAARAQQNDRSLLAEFIAAPICTGAQSVRLVERNRGEIL
jgi:hypothetical protein